MDAEDLYTDIILDLNKNPKNFGELPDRSLRLCGGNPLCGDEVQFDLSIENGVVSDIRFSGHGCSISRAAESLLTTLVKGKSLDEIRAIEPEVILKELGNIIQLRMKCALLGLHTLQAGLKTFEELPDAPTEIRGIKI